jgi:hypothetical protein
MALVSELELPELDYLAEDLKGERFHEVMNGLRGRGWLAQSPIGYFVLDREAAGFFLRSFDITADRGAAKALTFGAGIHYCLGASLARAELKEALAFLPARMPGLELDGDPKLGSIHGIYGLERLPLRWK